MLAQTKLTIGSVALSAVTLVLGAISLFHLNTIHEKVKDVRADAIPGLYSMAQWHIDLFQLRSAMHQEVLDHAINHGADSATYEAIRNEAYNKIKAQIKAYEPFIDLPEERRNFDALEPLDRRWQESWKRVQVLMKDGKAGEGLKVFTEETSPAMDDLEAQVYRIFEWNYTMGESWIDAALRAAPFIRVTLWIMMAVALFGGCGSVFLARSDFRARHRAETQPTVVASERRTPVSGDEISNMIEAIDEVAFRANTLALNASLAAARASEIGVAFTSAVDEVRDLAHRSAQAAEDTAAFVEESITKCNQESARLRPLSETIRSINESSARIKAAINAPVDVEETESRHS